MPRAAVFLAVTLVAASLGVIAQDNHSTAGSGSTTTTNVQNSSPAAAGSKAAQPGATARNSGDAEDQGLGQESRPEGANAQLPQTSTMLPLLGLIGLGSLVAGFFARR